MLVRWCLESPRAPEKIIVANHCSRDNQEAYMAGVCAAVSSCGSHSPRRERAHLGECWAGKTYLLKMAGEAGVWDQSVDGGC